MRDYLAEYRRWCEPPFDEETRRELASVCDEKEIEDRFYRDLSFGTGGLRGKLGAGTNRMNRYTVGRATQGLADFLRRNGLRGGAVIAYDSRHMSAEFALDAALILAANGVETYLFESLRPTPELSFAVRELGCAAGVVVTASHNPPAYNGYKVYLGDGGQIVPPYDRLIIDCVNAAELSSVKRISREEAEERGLLRFLGEEMDEKYLSALKKLSLFPVGEWGKKLKIVYTPLNGTGNLPVRRALKEWGFENVWVVPEQELPDGDFPTLAYPNPEDPAAFGYALRLAKEKDADLVLATDPDADRLGVYAKDRATGEYMPFTGNMSGLLIAEYVLSRREALGLLPARREDGALVTTIVSSDMAKEIAKRYGLTLIETLTGFKYIGEQIRKFEEAKRSCGDLNAEKGAYEYEFGFEESYGCLAGGYARDKDAVAAVVMLCEAAAFYLSEGRTLWEQMQEIYGRYGYFKEGLGGVTLGGADGAERIERMMRKLRAEPPEKIGGERVVAVRDYERGIRKIPEEDGGSPLELPKSNVLYFELEKGWCCARPSGTEPKIKFYVGGKGETAEEADDRMARLKEDLSRVVTEIA